MGSDCGRGVDGRRGNEVHLLHTVHCLDCLNFSVKLI